MTAFYPVEASDVVGEVYSSAGAAQLGFSQRALTTVVYRPKAEAQPVRAGEFIMPIKAKRGEDGQLQIAVEQQDGSFIPVDYEVVSDEQAAAMEAGRDE